MNYMNFIICPKGKAEKDTICVHVDNKRIASLEKLDCFFNNLQHDMRDKEISSVICIDDESKFFRVYYGLWINSDSLVSYFMNNEILFQWQDCKAITESRFVCSKLEFSDYEVITEKMKMKKD